ncbi:hypothetical protein DMB38_11715 [Streptomyces sp. WAC 06738]|uniref:hypothetical protein n=1 Tax=Streptomyces sp. WAC 06738 TaxID=2203210 RepID=UPI000F6F8BE0|nr:hypothetical protein [Streptomyces sp. WAC 06738]AZM46397.1 hypothetical protein DMB38_11715 [Streptomyces sp. WAC 06738]
MSATNFAVLLAATPTALLGAAVLRAVSGLRREVVTLRAELTARAATRDAGERAQAVPQQAKESAAEAADEAAVPAARPVPAAEIRIAVAQALADERERELAEARAFWAEQEARDSIDATPFPGDPVDFGGEVFIPRQADFAGFEPLLDPMDRLDRIDRMDRMDRLEHAEPAEPDDVAAADAPPAEGESAELAAARRRHPSHPDFRPQPAVADHERTVNRLEDLAAGRTPLTDVRLGPLGTLDVYVFADGTTLCLSPGHRDTAERLADALDGGTEPVLLGGSAISGAFALTFDCAGESVYILADRVIASL